MFSQLISPFNKPFKSAVEQQATQHMQENLDSYVHGQINASTRRVLCTNQLGGPSVGRSPWREGVDHQIFHIMRVLYDHNIMTYMVMLATSWSVSITTEDNRPTSCLAFQAAIRIWVREQEPNMCAAAGKASAHICTSQEAPGWGKAIEGGTANEKNTCSSKTGDKEVKQVRHHSK